MPFHRQISWGVRGTPRANQAEGVPAKSSDFVGDVDAVAERLGWFVREAAIDTITFWLAAGSLPEVERFAAEVAPRIH